MSTYRGVNASLALCEIGSNQEKALLVGAFSVIVRLHRLIVYSTSHNFIITAEDRGVLAVTLHA